jgi:hypothetical protein
MQKTGLLTVLALFVSISASGFAAKTVSPTTTLSAETGNNSSAADSFQGSSNGNAAAGNVSKVDTRTLMYSGSTTGIYAHYMPWFGTGSHYNVGYNTADANQSARTIDDMISRGIQGVIIDWYGRNFTHEDQSTQSMFNESQKHQGFSFAIMEDAGALKSDKQGDLIADLVYAWQKYEQAPNYMRINGRPVVFFFGVENVAGIDFNYVVSQVPGNPIIIVENTKGFNLNYSGGAFGWANGFTSDKTSNWGQAYLKDFYAQAQNPSKITFGATWKGFNDGIAAWTQGRVLGQQCGQTWLNTFSELNNHYSSGKQLQSLQLVTWNDYEEGTALELGIDNCVSISASASGNQLTWKVSGNENTIHHYTVFISTDGQALMPVTDVASGTHALDLGQFGFADGAYNIYVKAVGQPSIRNHMSGVAGWTSSGGGSTPTPTPTPAPPPSSNPPSGTDLSLTATPAAITLAAGSTASADVLLTPTGNFSVPVTLSCGTLPAGLSCSFSQSVVTPGTSKVTTQLSLKASSASSAALFGSHGTFALWFPGLSFGMFVFGDRKRSRKFWVTMSLLAILVMALLSTGCGGGVAKAASSSGSTQTSTSATQPGTYQLSILARAGTFQRTATATVTVQ